MEAAQDVSLVGMILAFAIIFGSLPVFRRLQLKVARELFVSIARMTVQLTLVGFYLTVIFKYNNPWVNVGYVLLMLGAANFSLLRSSGMKLELFSHTLPALAIGIFFSLTYYTTLVFSPDPLLDARYLIPVSGMLLGNSMNRSIITMERFYSAIKKDHEGYASLVTMGATVQEATMPYVRSAYKAGLSPSLANMATMGLVFLPGMMTGQILGGASPMTAVKYQIAIMLAIFVATEISTLLVIYFSMRKGFDAYGFLNAGVFKKPVATGV